MTINVLLADDHAIIRDGLRALLGAQPDICVVGDAANGRDAVHLVQRLHPDVVVMDIAMPELNGIEAVKQIREANPKTKVVILSIHAEAEHIYRAFHAGASSYILKESAGIELIAAVRSVHSGQLYLSQRINGIVFDAYVGSDQPKIDNRLSVLSEREREILQLVVEGKSNTAIARILCISRKTVETYRSRLMTKLGIKDVPSLVRFAIRHGITSLE